MVTLYNVISADGFIAGHDDSEDFIPDNLWPEFLKLCLEYKIFIMGRKTYDAIQKYNEDLLKPFEGLGIRKIVVSSNLNFQPKAGYLAIHSPEEAIAIAPDGLVSSGPTLNNYLLKNNLVGKIILYKVPVSVKDGIRPFDKETSQLNFTSEVLRPDGVIKYEYLVN